jgi:hypothetical protein
MRAVVAGAAVLVALASAGCGGGDGGGGDPLADSLAYLPADAGSVAVVDTNLSGAPVRALEDALRPRILRGRGFRQELEARTAVPPFDQIRFLFGHPLVVGTPGNGALVAGSREGVDNQYVGVLRVDDEDSLRAAIVRLLGYSPAGHESGADLYEAGGPPIAVEGGVLVVADTRETLVAALRRHDDSKADRFTRAQLDRATAGLAPDAPVKLYANLARVIGQPALRSLRQVRWVGALRTGAVAVRGQGGAVVVDAQASTDAARLTDSDLPFEPGSPTVEIPTRTGTIDSGAANQSRTTSFLLALLRAGRPTGRFASDVATVERERGIDFDREVLRQFDGPSSSALGADGSFGARSTVRDPARMARTLRRIAPDVPRLAQDLDPLRAQGLALLLLFAPDAPVGTSVLGAAPTTIERVDGERSLYRIRPAGGPAAGPGEIVFGLLGDVFVVGSDLPHARRAAREPTAAPPGLRGAAVVHSGPAALQPLLQRAFGLDPGPGVELDGSVQASRERVRATARLRMP